MPKQTTHTCKKILIRKLVILCFGATLFIFSCRHRHAENVELNVTTTAKNFQNPREIILNELPDSLKPNIILLKNRPNPLQVIVPSKAGGHYNVKTAGSTQRIELLPPVVHSFVNRNTNALIPASLQGSVNFQSFTSNDGLALDAITNGFVDHQGNLWFSTNGGGVSMYDGKSFTTFSTDHGLANNNVRVIKQDRQGNMWFGTQGGAYRNMMEELFQHSIKQTV